VFQINGGVDFKIKEMFEVCAHISQPLAESKKPCGIVHDVVTVMNRALQYRAMFPHLSLFNCDVIWCKSSFYCITLTKLGLQMYIS
jgi:hypothetical protein